MRGTQSPLRNCKTGDLDWVIIRENSEGEYAGQGGRSHRGHAWEVATEVAIFTRHAVSRLIRFSFEVAQKRPRKHLTVVTKSNAQRNGMVLWDEVAAEVAKDFPDVTVEKMLVDAMTTKMVLKPDSIDTIVASNLVSQLSSTLEVIELTYSSTLIFSLILLLPSLVQSALHQQATSTPAARTHLCLSLSTVLHSTSPARASPIRSPLSGQQLRCSHGWVKKRLRPS